MFFASVVPSTRSPLATSPGASTFDTSDISLFACSAPIKGNPSTPTASIPIPETALSVSAPPLGVCSDTMPSIVGQKNVLPKAYKVAATKIIPVPLAPESAARPAIAKTQLTISRGSGCKA